MFWICWPVSIQFDRVGEISVIIAFPHPRKGMEKSPVTLLLRRRLLLGVTEPTQETHWKMHCLISIAQGTAWYSRSRQPDITRFVQVVWDHRSIVHQWEFPVSLPFSTRKDISSSPGTAHCFFHPGRKGIGQGWGTKALGSCRKPAFYCFQGRKLFPCPQSLKMQCCGGKSLVRDSGVGDLQPCAKGKGCCGKMQACGRHINI